MPAFVGTAEALVRQRRRPSLLPPAPLSITSPPGFPTKPIDKTQIVC
ncbi:MAG: hypothetical protein KME26_20065 [Oscillatoria princeps RMCB-10]|nr:hypothetical protein [Oscillatoria princeps RMCB-10]